MTIKAEARIDGVYGFAGRNRTENPTMKSQTLKNLGELIWDGDISSANTY